MSTAAERVVLRDGTPGWVRPLLKTDRRALVAEFEQLSPESVRSRFLGHVLHLSESMLKHLVDDVDGVDHVALVTMVEVGDDVVPVAIGRILRYPDLPDAADLAVTVKDDWQGRGVATALLPVLLARRPDGVERILTEVATDNPASLAMLRRLGRVLTHTDEHGSGEVEVDLTGTAELAELPQAVEEHHRSRRRFLHHRDLVCPWFRG